MSTPSSSFDRPADRQPVPNEVPIHLRAPDSRSLHSLPFPNFLGIGAQKAGTSWLWKMLSLHPGLYLPEPKEHHYFDRELETVSPADYAARFRAGDGRIKGEITPAYATLSIERVQFVRSLMPDARLIFLLRNPVDRAWSQALMNIVTHDGRRYQDVPPVDFYAHFDSEHATDRGAYMTTIDRWEQAFSREHLLVDFYDRIGEDPRGLLTRVMTHVGVVVPMDWSAYPMNEVYFEGVKIPMPQAYRDYLRAKFHDEIERLYDHFGEPVRTWRSRV